MVRGNTIQPAPGRDPSEEADEEQDQGSDIGTGPHTFQEIGSVIVGSSLSSVATKAPPSYEQSNVWKAWTDVYQRRVDELYDQGVRTLPRGTLHVNLAHIRATYYVVFPEDNVDELRQLADAHANWKPTQWLARPEWESQIATRRAAVKELAEMARDERTSGPYGEVQLRDDRGRDLGIFLAEDLAFLATPYAHRDLGLLRRILRRSCPGAEGAIVQSRGLVKLPGKKWFDAKAIGLYLAAYERTKLVQRVPKRVVQPAYFFYDGKSPDGLLTEVLKQNLSEQTRIPVQEYEGLAVRNKWQAAKLAYEFATGVTIPVSFLKWEDPWTKTRGFRHPLEAFERLADSLRGAVETNYRALWDDDEDEPRHDATQQDLIRVDQFQLPQVGQNADGTIVELPNS